MTDEMQSILENELRGYFGRENWLLLELEKVRFRSQRASAK
jgi:hypothetical protein